MPSFACLAIHFVCFRQIPVPWKDGLALAASFALTFVVRTPNLKMHAATDPAPDLRCFFFAMHTAVPRETPPPTANVSPRFALE